MNRNSSYGIIVSLLIVMVVGVAVLYLAQSLWLKVILDRLNSSESSSSLPISSTPATSFSFTTAPGPVLIGTESVLGTLAITVTDVMYPANGYVGNSARYTTLDRGENYLLVNIKVRCDSSDKSCRLTEFDFGVETSSGGDYPAKLSGNFDLRNLFEGGEIQSGKSMSGSLIFVVHEGESGLVLYYPRLFGFGGLARFNLGK